MKLNVDFSKLPSDLAVFLGEEQPHTDALADRLAPILKLDEPDRQALRQQIMGAVIEVIDGYTEHATRPTAEPPPAPSS